MTPHLADDLKADEGLRLKAYPDPLTGAAPWTIGYGHTGLDVHPALAWTPVQAEAALHADIARVCAGLDEKLAWWRRLNDPRQDVLVNAAFNMGVAGLLGFRNTLAAIRLGAFDDAARGLRTSRWAGQVGARAERLARQMQSGVRA